MQAWIIAQLIVDFVLLAGFFVFIRQMAKKEARTTSNSVINKIDEMIVPLLKEAENVANRFDEQLREKQRIIWKLNEHLDERIISLNLLLNRTDLYDLSKSHVVDEQKSIVVLAGKGLDAESIATRLSISVGEVQLVLDLRKRFSEMEIRESSS
ncbi:MAG: hypothetical protein V1753_12455 [Pseudomonadota bacterium]